MRLPTQMTKVSLAVVILATASVANAATTLVRYDYQGFNYVNILDAEPPAPELVIDFDLEFGVEVEALGLAVLQPARQRAFLRDIAVGELQAQKQRLDVYTIQARFALAAIYDIAATVGEASE